MNKRLEPKLFLILRKGYTSKEFTSDLTAGIIVGIAALPLAIAFANASGEDNLIGSFDEALARASEIISVKKQVII